MRIRVRLFAVLRDAAGVGEVELELPDGATAREVANPLAEQYPGIARHLPRIAYAVNRNYAPPDAPLQDGDEVALIPPVSGG